MSPVETELYLCIREMDTDLFDGSKDSDHDGVAFVKMSYIRHVGQFIFVSTALCARV